MWGKVSGHYFDIWQGGAGKQDDEETLALCSTHRARNHDETVYIKFPAFKVKKALLRLEERIRAISF